MISSMLEQILNLLSFAVNIAIYPLFMTLYIRPKQKIPAIIRCFGWSITAFIMLHTLIEEYPTIYSVIPLLLMMICYTGKPQTRIIVIVTVFTVNQFWQRTLSHLLDSQHTMLIFLASDLALLLTWQILHRTTELRHNPVERLPHILLLLLIPLCCVVISGLKPASTDIRASDWMLHRDLICLALSNVGFWLYAVLGKSETAEKQKNRVQRLLEKQNAAYLHEIQVMEESQMLLRSFRHDMKNHLLQMQAMITAQDDTGLQNYLSDARRYLDSAEPIVDCGNPQISSILNLKLSEAQQNDITVQTEIAVPQTLSIPAFDWNIMLGNLLDNAIRAASASVQKRLLLHLHYDHGTVRLLIRNTVPDKPLPPRKGDHGIGLQSVKQIVTRYGGEMQTVQKDGIFTVSLMLYIDKSPVN